MNEPLRLLQMRGELSAGLSRALEPSAVEPSALELQQLTSKLGSALGVALTPPVAASAGTTGTVPGTAVVSAAKVLPAWKLGVWVLGGVALGVGLSGAVTAGISATDSPTPPVAAAPSTSPLPVARTTFTADPPLLLQPTSRSDEQDTAPPTATGPHKAPSADSTAAPSALTLPSEGELSILHRAQQVLRMNPALALSLSARHELEFTSGALAQEREVIAIDALLRLGRTADAEARAQRFEAKYAGSAHVRRVQQLLDDAHSH